MTTKKASENTATADQLRGDLPERVAEADEKGYWGTVPDPTPNEAYTLKGVSEGQPTPETDSKLRAEALAHSADVAADATGGHGDATDAPQG